jgi:hypothetical protein
MPTKRPSWSNSLYNSFRGVGSPGGMLDPRAMAGNELPNSQSDPRMMAAAAQFIPGIGDAVGAISDAGMYATDPSSRTPLNGLLSLAALAPGIPSAAGKMKPLLSKPFLSMSQKREALRFWVQESGSLKQAAKDLRAASKNAPELRDVVEYADDMDGILRFHRADDTGAKLRKWLRSQRNPDLSLAAEIDMIESGAKKIPRHPGGW